MTLPFPFAEERFMGVVHRVDGNSIDVTLPYAASPSTSPFGERVLLGAVGQFIVVDIGGKAVFGRLLEIYTPQADVLNMTSNESRSSVRASGRIQLLSTLNLDGSYLRGIERHPRIGDLVYSAGTAVLSAIVSGVSRRDDSTSDVMIDMGTLSSTDGLPVSISASKLFGRHLAVLGATGSGKSWTLGHLMEQVAARKGRLLLIDATGEFSSLEDLAEHVSLGSKVDLPEGSTKASLPHNEFGENDRHAFLRPSGGTQLPKLRSAIRSLRLAHILGPDHALVGEGGTIYKAGQPRRPFVEAEREHAQVLEDPFAPFSLDALPNQISMECVYDTDFGNTALFGKYVPNDVAYCNSLVSRVIDMIRTDVIADVVNPKDNTPSVLTKINAWFASTSSPSILRVSLKNLAFSHFIREIAVNTIGRRLLTAARAGEFSDRPLIVVVDEAHQFFGRTIGDEFSSSPLDAFESIAKEGRKYGLTVCMATQRPGDIPAGVLSQAGMMIVHRLADKRDQERVEQASAELDQTATKLLPSLVPGEGVLVGADFPVPLSIHMTAPTRHPFSYGPDYGKWDGAEEKCETSRAH